MASRTNNTATAQPAGITAPEATISGFQTDVLDLARLREIAPRVASILEQDPEILALFNAAWAGNYEGTEGQQRFFDDIEKTKFWRENATSARRYIILSMNADDPDFQILQEQSREYVRQTAQALGLEVDEATVNALSEESLMRGWGEEGREYELQRKMLGTLQGEEGAAAGAFTGAGVYGDTINNLRDAAFKNGVDLPDSWYESAAKSVASQMSQEDFWLGKIREDAASKFPVFKDQIMAGMGMRDIANPYMKMMADEWELNINDINLNDTTLLSALTGYTENGQPRAQNLGEFRMKLRQDPRWLETSKAQNEITSIAGKVMQMFGVMA